MLIQKLQEHRYEFPTFKNWYKFLGLLLEFHSKLSLQSKPNIHNKMDNLFQRPTLARMYLLLASLGHRNS